MLPQRQTTKRPAELDERDYQLEQRLAELRDELAAIQGETVSAAQIQQAVALFDPVWDLRLVPERFRILLLLAFYRLDIIAAGAPARPRHASCSSIPSHLQQRCRQEGKRVLHAIGGGDSHRSDMTTKRMALLIHGRQRAARGLARCRV